MSMEVFSCARGAVGRVRTVALLLPAVAAFAGSDPPTLPVVPHPREVEARSGSFPLDPEHMVIVPPAASPASLDIGIEELAETFRQVAGTRPRGDERAGLAVRLGLPPQDASFASLCRDKGLWPDDRLGKEGYALLIESDQILLAAPTETGLYYGIQTLKQLLRGYGSRGALPAVRIADWPALRYRGVMDDISRGPVPTLAFMKEQVRRLAELKINLLTYYTEHVAEIEGHRAFAPADGAVSTEEWRELAAYARARHVMLVGNFQSFGHFEKILAHPAYAPLGESGRLLSPVLPESLQLLREIYAELAPAFDAPFFHVNSDETWDLGRGASRRRVDSLGSGIVYAEHVNGMHDLLEPHGVRMMLWADMVLAAPEALERIPKDVVMMTWTYDPLGSYEPWIRPLSDAGFDVMVCPGVLNSNRLLPDYRQTLPNIDGFVAEGAASGALGALTTVWDDGGASLFALDWFGVAYGADQSWNPSREAEGYPRRFDAGIYGNRGAGLSAALTELVEMAGLAPTDGMNDRVLWQRVVPERGESLRLGLADWDRVDQLAAAAESLLTRSSPLVYSDDAGAIRFIAGLYRHLAALRVGMLEAARAYRRAALQQFARPDSARDALAGILDLVSDLRKSTFAVRDGFRGRWLRENRTYALDHVLDRYDQRIAALTDVEHRVAAALRDLDMGQVLPPPSDVRLAVEEAAGAYFREWLALGPLPHPGGSDRPPVDFLAGSGGEAHVRPGVTDEVRIEGVTYRWHRIASPLFDAVDLTALYPEHSRKVALYAFATLDSPRAQEVRASLGSNDGVDLFLNGKRLYSLHRKRNLTIDEDTVVLPLVKGRNHLLLKISQGAGDWGFSFRLPDVVVRSSKNRYRIPD